MFNMLRIARLTGSADLEEQARKIAENFARSIQQHPLNHIQMLVALHHALFPAPEIVITGDTDDPATQEMFSTIHGSRLLDILVLFKPTEAQSEIVELAPFTRGLSPVDGQTTAYLCRNYQCEMPTKDKDELTRMLGQSVTTGLQ
jgi:uncharacterized protein YyaL (SSP411 family)